MIDSATGKTPESVFNAELTKCAWGHACGEEWVCSVEALVPTAPAPLPNVGEFISYCDWVDARYSHDKKLRTQLNASFTQAGQPGERFAADLSKLVDAMKLPDGSPSLLVNSFLELLCWLKRERRSFTICFRTFGEDLPQVSNHFNAFCQGKHPLFPDVRLDGSDGEPDYRFRIDDMSRCGTFHRNENNDVLSCVMGTLEQAGEGTFRSIKDRSLSFYDRFPDTKVMEGFPAVRAFLETALLQRGTYAFRDAYHCWNSSGKKFSAGKPFIFLPSLDAGRHDVFFDDNAYGETPCVHPINLCDLDHEHPPEQMQHTHVHCAWPLGAVARRDYFVSALTSMELAYAQLLANKQRLTLLDFTAVP